MQGATISVGMHAGRPAGVRAGTMEGVPTGTLPGGQAGYPKGRTQYGGPANIPTCTLSRGSPLPLVRGPRGTLSGCPVLSNYMTRGASISGLNLSFTIVIPILLLMLFSPASSNFNLYLKKPEVKRTLGLDAELYYIREGVLNEYALSYKVLVAVDVSKLYFTWEATARKPIQYTMSVSVGSPEDELGVGAGAPSSGPPALGPTSVNISLAGIVPKDISTFQLHLPCTGLSSAEVPLTLIINFTSPRPREPHTSVAIRRRKICLKGQFSEQYSRHLDPVGDAAGPVLTALYYGIFAAVGFTLVVTSIVIVAVVRRRKLKQIPDHSIYCSDIDSMKSFHSGGDRGRTHSLARSVTVSNAYAVPDGLSINSYATPFTTYQRTPNSTLQSKRGHKNSAFQDSTDIIKDLSKEIVRNFSRNGSKVYSRDNSIKKNNYLHGIVDKRISTFENDIIKKGSNRREGSRGYSKTVSHKGRRKSGKTDNMKKQFSCHSLLSGSLHSRPEVVVDPSLADLQEKFRQMRVESSRVSLRNLVQEGTFSKVYRGALREGRTEQEQEVLIKTVGSSSTLEDRVVLCREGTRFFNLYHCNLLTLMGIAFMDNAQPYLIYPLQGYKNLKLYLISECCRPLRAKQLVEVALQAAHGLAFLHQANVLHGDVAARNCMINSHMQLRLCDSALSTNLFPGDYDVLPPDSPRPIKWLAYEAIIGHVISSASDVWAYGVLLWELSTCGQLPYVEVPPNEMRDYLHDGYRLAQPLNCPPELYKVMAFCWAIQAHDRPHAKFIIDFLTDFQQRLV